MRRLPEDRMNEWQTTAYARIDLSALSCAPEMSGHFKENCGFVAAPPRPEIRRVELDWDKNLRRRALALH
jgi:hypothetical protein